jgi:hypothetical protein
LETALLLAQALAIVLLKSILGLTVLVLERVYLLLRLVVWLFQLVTIRRRTPPLLGNQLALLLL